MALRVLLADESSTIKKVIQLALQDFGVEVKAVPVGTDVEAVAKQFKPDLILADVLLVKKNGYEIATSFKQQEDLQNIPIVLMWSGFIAFDETKFAVSGAEGKIEKPFDADTLRDVVKKCVPRLQGNQISKYLKYELPEFVEAKPSIPAAPDTPGPSKNTETQKVVLTPPPPPLPLKPQISGENSAELGAIKPPPTFKPDESLTTTTSFEVQSIELPSEELEATSPFDQDLEDVDDFQQVPLPGRRRNTSVMQDDWSSKKLMQGEPVLEKSIAIPDPFSIDVSDAVIATMDQAQDSIALMDISNSNDHNSSTKGHKPHNPMGQGGRLQVQSLGQQIDPQRLEELVREQVTEVLKEIAWRVVPDIAERVVREEMQKLLKEAERLQ